MSGQAEEEAGYSRILDPEASQVSHRNFLFTLPARLKPEHQLPNFAADLVL